MKESLSLSFFCLMGISTLAYGGWTKYVLGDGKMAKGDCLEMLCPHGCVEDDKGNANCCSEGKLGDKCWGELCCQEGLFCSSSTGEGKCVECVKDEDCAGELVCNSDKICQVPQKECVPTCNECQICDKTKGECLANTALNGQQVQDICHQCNNGAVILKNTENTVVCASQCCPKGNTCNPDGSCKTPEEGDCVELYQRKENHPSGMGNSKGCCPTGTYLTNVSNTLGSPRGYIVGGGNTQYGCCPTERTTSDQKCCATNQKFLSTGCCATNKIYLENGEEKCCPTGTQLPMYNQTCNTVCGCRGGTICNPSTLICECPQNYIWNENKCDYDCSVYPLPEDIHPKDRAPSLSSFSPITGGPYACGVDMTVSWTKVSFSFHVKVDGKRPAGSANSLGSYINGKKIHIPAGSTWSVDLFSDWPYINATGILPQFKGLEIKFSRP